MTDRFLKPDFLDKEAGGDKYLGGDKINYVLPNGDTEVYRLDNQKLLDGIRRKFKIDKDRYISGSRPVSLN